MRFLTRLRSEERSDPAERRRGPGPARRRTAVRPRLEVLEERRVLSTLTVTSSLDNGGRPGDGTLRGEIAAAQSGDTIVFDPSLDGQTITLGSGRSYGGIGIQWSQLEVNKNLTIQGPEAGLLAISGGTYYGSRVFQVDAGATVTISGLTIEDGHGNADYSTNSASTPAYYDGCGGGILNLGTLTLSGCNVIENDTSPSWGTAVGGIGWRGGGICNFGTMTLGGSTVSANSSYSWGGGIYNDGTMTLSSSTVNYNSASVGGGILNDTQGHLTTLSSDVQNNTASDGAGICNFGTMTLGGSTVTGNSASSWGGGIYNDGPMTLSGSTVTGNSAGAGGGIFNDRQGKLTILSSVVQNNTAHDGADICSLGSLTISKDSKVGKVSHK